MPLPESASEFLDLAFEHANNNGVIHYYRFLEDENWELLLEEIKKVDKSSSDYEVLRKVKCGERGPAVDRVCIDITVF